MMPLPDFELLRPATLDDALRLLAMDDAMPLAGGTDLLPNLRRGLHHPQRVIDLGALSTFDAIESHNGSWRLGAGATLATLARDQTLARALPALAQAAGNVAGPGHRSVATLGGNLCQDTRCVFYNQSAWWRAANDFCLKREGSVCHVAPQGQRCHAAFEGDLAPALLAYGAEVDVLSARGQRRIPLQYLYRDDGAAHLTLAPGELLVAVHVSQGAPGGASAYRKVRTRGAMDFPLAGVAVRLRTDNDVLAELAVGISGTNSRPLLLEGTQALLGQVLNEALLKALAKLVQKQVSPMRSTVTAANHRRLVAATTARRLVQELAAA
jgi:4-hydroxybenzoyl-CoA reductase subunit beta